MRKLILYTEALPNILIAFYIGFFFLIGYQSYSNWYEVMEILDNTLVLTAITMYLMGGYKHWNLPTKKSFWTVIILNIINILPISNYYEIYSLIVQLFIITTFLAIILRQKVK